MNPSHPCKIQDMTLVTYNSILKDKDRWIPRTYWPAKLVIMVSIQIKAKAKPDECKSETLGVLL